MAIGVAAGLFLFFIRVPVLGLYRLSPETTELANAFLIVLSVVCVGMSYQMPTNAIKKRLEATLLAAIAAAAICPRIAV